MQGFAQPAPFSVGENFKPRLHEDQAYPVAWINHPMIVWHYNASRSSKGTLP